MDANSTTIAKEQLEQLIATLVNAWLQKQGNEYSYNEKQEIIKKFCNLSIQAVYEMLHNNLLDFPVTINNNPVTPDMIKESLQTVNYHQLSKKLIPDDFMGATPILKWLKQKEIDNNGKPLSGRLINILELNAHHFQYIEHISKQNFLTCRNAGEVSWKEFVSHRGF